MFHFHLCAVSDPWLKKSKKKKSKPPKKKEKMKKKKKGSKKAKRASSDEEDSYCDKALAQVAFMRKSTSYVGSGNANGATDGHNNEVSGEIWGILFFASCRKFDQLDIKRTNSMTMQTVYFQCWVQNGISVQVSQTEWAGFRGLFNS